MKVIVVDDYGQMSQWAAQIIAEQVRENRKVFSAGDRIDSGRHV
ncbi:hypothetical protein LAJLEIBI_03029 [[Clostridium] hylemonae DSM 15053]|nr:hypothetical protein [[Clostridium] hylemonae]QEK18998.1 hypothetical protein LAJLEIBI_03029 [[Clostridium] hylemonae DSM 15053]